MSRQVLARAPGIPSRASLLAGLLAMLAGCSSSISRSTWTEPVTVETIASARAIAEQGDPGLDRLCMELAKGNASVLDKYEFIEVGDEFHLTAYAAPALEARRQPSARFHAPIRGLPPGHVHGDSLPTRRDLFRVRNATTVLGWVENPLDAYLAEVNGSVQLRFGDDTIACLGWAETNGRPYTSLGRLLVERGYVAPDAIDLAAIRAMHERDPELVETLMLENDRAVFFESIDCGEWPRAGTGAVLRPERSVAIDPDVIPLGSVLLLETTLADGTPFRRIVAAVDIGGAIIGNRVDLYLGVGPAALDRAGRQSQPARIRRLVERSGGEQAHREGP
ncbi:MAG: MltA domain-containing protein [Phycisphaerales bacterium]|nr:MltA domain-containing protein [Phycisphaerales bacterium]